MNRHGSPESHCFQSHTMDPLGFSMTTKGQQRRESAAAMTLDLALAMNAGFDLKFKVKISFFDRKSGIFVRFFNRWKEKALRKYSFEQNTGSPNRSRRESINIMANSPRNSIPTFGISRGISGVSNSNILNELERLERKQRFQRKFQKICACFGL